MISYYSIIRLIEKEWRIEDSSVTLNRDVCCEARVGPHCFVRPTLYVTLEGPMLKIFTTAAHHQPRQSVFLGRVAVEGMWTAKENEEDGYGGVWSFVIRWPPPVRGHSDDGVASPEPISWPAPSELEFLHIGSYDEQECEEWFRAVKQAIISVDRTYRIQYQYRQRRLSSSDGQSYEATANNESQLEKIRTVLPDRLKSKYPAALKDVERLDAWEPVFAGHGCQIAVNKSSRATKFRLVQLFDGFDSDRVWREIKEGSFGTWLSRVDGCCFQPITTIATDEDTTVTTDYACLFVEEERVSRLKIRADLIRALIDSKKQMVATTSGESFEGLGRRVEMDYIFWSVEPLPNRRGSSVTCVVSIAPPEKQKDILVQRFMKYLSPNLSYAQGVVSKIFCGRYNRSGNPVHDLWFRHIWKLEDFLNSTVKKGDFESGRNDPRIFDYDLASGCRRAIKSGDKISGTDKEKRVHEMLARIEKTAAETGQVCPTESDCRRFLTASEWQVDAAFTKLRDTLAWRLTTFGIGHPPRGIDPDSISAERRKGAIYLRGRDKLGRPILVFRARLHEPRQTDQQEFERYLVYCVERCVSKIVDDGLKEETQQLIVLADMSGCGYNNLDVPLTKSVVRLLADRYPERIGSILVTNLNWAGKQFWNIIRPSLSEETITKIHLVPREDPVEYLSRFIDPRNVPAFCGGIDTYVYSIENDDLFSDDEEGVE
ncbi:hypothetical protein FOZ63_024444 [Perkinsus olseni]|uniref:CRAL-TRIO domain-containing protein n=1 Tax=Perkinsus olseni TaxID=32597 RepID=A0A7J6NZ87_PEROL|nr:hypothetical protein FOZ63_024444 [Perkinsus olseni]